MAAVSESETKILDPHIPSGEQLIEAYSGDEKTVAVTDRRVIELRHRNRNRKEETELYSTLLTTDYIVGTKYEREQESDFPVIEALIAAILAVIGIAGVAIGINGEPIGMVVGVVFLALTGAVFYFTEQSESGDVSITVRRAGDLPNGTWTLPHGETDVPQAISEQVAKLNRP